MNNEQSYFLIVGDGTEYGKVEKFIDEKKPKNVKLMRRLPKEDYDRLVAACDVGMIFLDYRFTIPNFPSRLLAYMQAKLPVLAATDLNTDIGKVIVDGGFGWWVGSNSPKNFSEAVRNALNSDVELLGTNAFKYLNENYSAEKGCNIILQFYNK